MSRPRKPVRCCRSCGAPIRFIRMVDGRWMPADARPSQLRGNILVQDDAGRVLGGLARDRARDQGYDLYVSHFASCPGADQHRRDRAAERASQYAARRKARAAFARLQRERPGQGALFR